MLRALAPILLMSALLAVPTSSAAITTTSSSTGDVDTYTMGTFSCEAEPGPELPSIRDPWSAAPDCVMRLCPSVLYTFAVTLRLIAPSPGDAVAVTVVGESPGAPFSSVSPGGITPGPFSTYPTAVATHDGPEASVWIHVSGCRDILVAVTGLVVDGKVDYELVY